MFGSPTPVRQDIFLYEYFLMLASLCAVSLFQENSEYMAAHKYSDSEVKIARLWNVYLE
jgi:hypothetical protein